MPNAIDQLTLAFIAQHYPTVGIVLNSGEGFMMFLVHARCAMKEGSIVSVPDEGEFFELYHPAHLDEPDAVCCWDCDKPTTLPSEELLCQLNTSTSTG